MAVEEKRAKKRLRYLLLPKLEVTPEERAEEIKEYLRLFGHDSERATLYVYLPPQRVRGFGRRYTPAELERMKRYYRRYSGMAFTVVGHTHDPTVLVGTRLPKSRKAGFRYLGSIARPEAHLKLPLDFCPTHFKHENEEELKRRFGTYLIGLYAPTLKFASERGEIVRTLEWKRELLRRLYRIGKRAKPEERWRWLEDLKRLGYFELKKEILEAKFT